MSRLTARKRRLMSGLWVHPEAGILYYRKVTPPDLWTARSRLEKFGVKVAREIHRSFGTKDRRPAGQRCLQLRADQGNDADSHGSQPTLVHGLRLRVLTVVDDCTSECLILIAVTSLPGLRVAIGLRRWWQIVDAPR